MAEIQESDRGGRKSVGVELNLVPFIDLMSVLIIFLLLTAVWTQISMIQIGSSIYGKKDVSNKELPLSPPDFELVLKLEIFEQGYVLTVGSEKIKLPLVNGEFDDVGLISRLERIKKLYPHKMDAALAMADFLPYERLIKGMDAFLVVGFTQLSVLTGGL